MLSSNHKPSPDPDNEWLKVLQGLMIASDELDPSVFFNFPLAVPKEKDISNKFTQSRKHAPVDPIASAGFSSE